MSKEQTPEDGMRWEKFSWEQWPLAAAWNKWIIAEGPPAKSERGIQFPATRLIADGFDEADVDRIIANQGAAADLAVAREMIRDVLGSIDLRCEPLSPMGFCKHGWRKGRCRVKAAYEKYGATEFGMIAT